MAIIWFKGDPTEQLVVEQQVLLLHLDQILLLVLKLHSGVFGASGKLQLSIPKYVLTTTLLPRRSRVILYHENLMAMIMGYGNVMAYACKSNR